MNMVQFRVAVFAGCFLHFCFLTAVPLFLFSYHMRRGGISLHDEVWAICEKGSTTDTSAQVPGI